MTKHFYIKIIILFLLTLWLKVDLYAQTNLSPNESVCEGELRTYRVEGNSGSTIFWTVTGGVIVNDGVDQGTSFNELTVAAGAKFESIIQIRWGSAGNYQLTAREETPASCVSGDLILNVTVNALPDLSSLDFTVSSPVCYNTAPVLTVTGLNANTAYTIGYNDNGTSRSETITTDGSGSAVLTTNAITSNANYNIESVAFNNGSTNCEADPAPSLSNKTAIIDNIAPTASNPADITVQCSSDIPLPDVNVVTDEADNCGVPTVAFIADVSSTNELADFSGQNNLVTNNGAVWVEDGRFAGDGAYQFADNYLMLDEKITLNGDFTVSFWEKLSSGIGNDDVVLGDLSVNSLNHYDGKIRIYANGANRIIASGNTPEDIWIHYAIVRNGISLKIYQNGVLADQNNNGSGWDFSFDYIGRGPVPANFIDGSLDELRVYNSALTAGEISDVFNENNPRTSNLLLYMPFNRDNCPETIIRSYSVTDAAGNSTNVTQKIIVDDTELPVLVNKPADLTVECIVPPVYNNYSDFVNAGGLVTDNCGLNTVSFAFVQDVSDGKSNPETITRSYQISDNCGNVQTLEQKIILHDLTNPTISCSGNQNENLTAACNFTLPDYTGLATVSDNCDASPVVTQSPVAGTIITANTTITLTVTDASGNSNNCTFDVILSDAIAPVLNDLSDLSISDCADDETTIPQVKVFAGLALPSARYSDNCSATFTIQYRIQLPDASFANNYGIAAAGASISDPSGFEFPEGVSTIFFRVIDESGNVSNIESYTIKVNHKPNTGSITY